QRSPPWLLTTAACGGLGSTPDCRTRRTYLHLSYSYAAPYGPAILVTQDPQSVHLARHQDKRWGRNTPYWLWRRDREEFERYQRIQHRPVFQVNNFVASFVVPPSNETLFVG